LLAAVANGLAVSVLRTRGIVRIVLADVQGISSFVEKVACRRFILFSGLQVCTNTVMFARQKSWLAGTKIVLRFMFSLHCHPPQTPYHPRLIFPVLSIHERVKSTPTYRILSSTQVFGTGFKCCLASEQVLFEPLLGLQHTSVA